MQGLSRSLIETLRRSLLPSLRGVALAYTGLGGMLALVVVLAVALTPVAPSITEPARQAVTSIVQPTGDALVTLFNPPPARTSPVFTSSTTLDVTISEEPLPTPEEEAPQVDVAPTAVALPAPVALAPAPAAPAEEIAPEEEAAPEPEQVLE